jgi:3-deoxy-D-manno-octulosonic-acid transferase
MYALYSAVLGVGLLAYLPALLARRRRAGYGRDLAQRLGRLGDALPAEPRCWIHAVSVGESAAAVPLVEGIRQRWPELGIVVSTITPTGARIVGERLAGTATHRYFPIDLPGPVRRALDAARPRFFIAIETELWPNFLRALARRRIPAMIANGRISDRSFRRYRWVRGLMRRVLANVSVFAMQTEEDARRIIALGAPPARVVVTGNLKTDLVPDAGGDDAAAWRERLRLGPDARLWIAGSTHRGEEAIVLDAFRRAARRWPCCWHLATRSGPARSRNWSASAGWPRSGAAAFPATRRPARSSSSTRWASWPPSTRWPRSSSSAAASCRSAGTTCWSRRCAASRCSWART